MEIPFFKIFEFIFVISILLDFSLTLPCYLWLELLWFISSYSSSSCINLLWYPRPLLKSRPLLSFESLLFDSSSSVIIISSSVKKLSSESLSSITNIKFQISYDDREVLSKSHHQLYLEDQSLFFSNESAFYEMCFWPF